MGSVGKLNKYNPMHFMRNGRLLLLFAAMACAGNCAAVNGLTQITWQPHALSNGSPVLFEIKASTRVHAVSGLWMGHNVSFFRSTADKAWYGLAAVPLTAKAGSYELR